MKMYWNARTSYIGQVATSAIFSVISDEQRLVD